MGKKGIISLKTIVGREWSISRCGSDCAVEVYMSEEGVTVLRQGAAPRMGAAKSSDFGEGKL